eukprot:COSAG01_NODE_2564_length_7448_cov_10.275238_7_plen_179_part_00
MLDLRALEAEEALQARRARAAQRAAGYQGLAQIMGRGQALGAGVCELPRAVGVGHGRGETFLRVHWVAVPKAVRARRVNRPSGSPLAGGGSAGCRRPGPAPAPAAEDVGRRGEQAEQRWQLAGGGAPTLSTPTRRWPSLGSRRMSADSLMTPTPATCDHAAAASADWSAALEMSSPEV